MLNQLMKDGLAGVLHRDAGNISLAVDAYEHCLQIDPDSRNAGQNRLLAINYINDGGDDELYIAHRYELYPSKLSL
jgi:protein O-GlcNAc transferase